MSDNKAGMIEPTPVVKVNWRELLLVFLLLLATFMPRVLSLDHFATTDERLWLTRSANFYCAMTKQKYVNTFQREHPGVTVMWAGMLGYLWEAPEYRDDCVDKITGREDHEEIFAEHDLETIDLLAACRFFAVLVVTILLMAGFFYARRLVGFWPALIGFLVIALDPYHIALSRLLHLDALLSSFMLLSFLAFMVYLREWRFRDLLVSGIAAGLSWLTKSPGLFLAPFVGLLAFLDLLCVLVHEHGWQNLSNFKRNGEIKVIWRFTWPLLVWGIVGALVFFALFPAMWVDPSGTLSGIFAKGSEYANVGHGSPIFFNGQIIELGNLGLEFYYFYPLTFLWRTTPMVLLGLLAALLAFLGKYDLFARKPVRRIIVGLLLFALIFTFAMTLGMKKFDRYLLPVYPVVDLLAGFGLFGGAHWLMTRRWWRVIPKYSALLFLGLLLVAQLVPLVQTFPYYLTYYNPLLGGSQKATDVMQIGWGEGLDEAARYLNAKPDAEDLYVNSWYYFGCFSYFFHGQGESMSGKYSWGQETIEDFFDADYAVFYIHQWQRKNSELMLRYIDALTPEHSIWLDGLEYVRIYRMDSIWDFYEEPTYEQVDVSLDDQVLLEGYNLSQRRFAPGDALRMAFSWRAIEAPEKPYKVFVHILDGNGQLVAQSDAEPKGGYSPTTAWEPGEQTPDHHVIYLPSNLQPGTYTLWVGMYEASGERLGMTKSGADLGDVFPLGQLEIVNK